MRTRRRTRATACTRPTPAQGSLRSLPFSLLPTTLTCTTTRCVEETLSCLLLVVAVVSFYSCPFLCLYLVFFLFLFVSLFPFFLSFSSFSLSFYTPLSFAQTRSHSLSVPVISLFYIHSVALTRHSTAGLPFSGFLFWSVHVICFASSFYFHTSCVVSPSMILTVLFVPRPLS